VLPEARGAWAQAAQARVVRPGLHDAIDWEMKVAAIAIEWAAASAYPADVLFSPETAQSLDLLVLVEGFHVEPVARSLAAHFGDKAVTLPFPRPDTRGAIALHECLDSEDEAERAAACVLRHIEAGRAPVALAVTDRVLARRVQSLLAARGVAVHDDTGWKLSTTRAAASLMAALRGCEWDAATDSVIDWLKNAPAAAPATVLSLERRARQSGRRDWRALQPGDWGESAAASGLAAQVQAWREAMAAARPLREWIAALRELLQSTRQWEQLSGDPAGQRVLEALRLYEGDADELAALPQAGRRIGLRDFAAWCNEVIEAESYRVKREQGEAILVPLAQVLGRPFQALVLPGCDERNLPASPDPAMPWTESQRAALGLPTRADLTREQREAWQCVLATPHCDLLWRAGDDNGEQVLASPLVQLLQLKGGAQPGAEPRDAREVPATPVARPQPTASLLRVSQLSASAYEDLRRCPYRFFAMRQLGLREADEIDAEVDKRDFGTWLHAVLREFHALLAQCEPAQGRAALFDEVALRVMRQHRLDDGEFLPFEAVQPAVRDAYLKWLADHEAGGAHFEEAEVAKERALPTVRLVGRIDRVDRLADGRRLVMDYKTESLTASQSRMDDALEDTQLAFYAALLDDDAMAAAYLNLGERGKVKEVPHDSVIEARDQLIEAIEGDLGRIAAGEPLPALGEGAVCDYCGARGLCRKDFWS
jgi:ATP-dependent helicase/nuclease subunit B